MLHEITAKIISGRDFRSAFRARAVRFDDADAGDAELQLSYALPSPQLSLPSLCVGQPVVSQYPMHKPIRLPRGDTGSCGTCWDDVNEDEDPEV